MVKVKETISSQEVTQAASKFQIGKLFMRHFCCCTVCCLLKGFSHRPITFCAFRVFNLRCSTNGQII